ncbi:MAG: hypothetical protein HKN49_01210 [Gammaproteobacteria bacterium]|nr:hypothetical protein [Gammaproteobacteria bacterium]
MKTVSKTFSLIVRLGISAAALLISQHALAAGTDAGTVISNTALVDYQVGSVAQPQESSGAVTFAVDRRVDFTVVRTGSALTDINAGAAGSLEFVVTNTSNDFLDFNLGSAQLVAADGEIYTGDPTTIDDDGRDTSAPTYAIGTFESAPGAGDAGLPDCSAPATIIDELPEDISVRVFLCASAPAGAINDDVAGLRLTATATDDTATPLVESADTKDGVENVFATSSGTNTEDDIDGFRIKVPALAVTKSYVVEGGGPAIPGAIVIYTITIDNTGGVAPATAISIGDTIDASIELEDSGASGYSDITVNDGTNPADTCRAELTAGDNGDACTWDSVGRVLTVASRNAAGDPINVANGTTGTITFRVVIQ